VRRSTSRRRPEVSTGERDHVDRGGRGLRVADPDLRDPLDSSFRCADRRTLEPASQFRGALPEWLRRCRASQRRAPVWDSRTGPRTSTTRWPPCAGPRRSGRELHGRAVTDTGLVRLGLPATYRHDSAGRTVRHDVCQAIGQAAYDDAEPGVACRSAATGAAGEELVWFALPRRARPTRVQTRSFDEWFWAASQNVEAPAM